MGWAFSSLALERDTDLPTSMSRPACRPGSTTKRADTSPETTIVEGGDLVNEPSRSDGTNLTDDLAS